MKLNSKIFTFFVALFCLCTACKKEQPIDFGEEDPPEVDTEIDGTSWSLIESEYFADERVYAMETFADYIVITILDLTHSNVLYDGSNLTEINQSLGGGVGLEKIEIIDGELHGLGLYGMSSGYRYSPGESDPWSPSIYALYTPAYAMARYGGYTVVGTGIEPYIRSSEDGGWTEFGGGLDAAVYDLLYFDGDLIAAGNFENSGGTALNHVAKWNGSNWEQLGEGLNGKVRDLIVFDEKLFAVGSFVEAGNGNSNCRYIAVWDGTSWSAVGGTGMTGGLNGAYKLSAYEGQLFVGGEFEGAGGINSSNIIKWDGSNWVGLAGGAPDKIEEICVFENQLYVANGNNVDDSFFLMRLE